MSTRAKRAALLIKPFPYNHCISDVAAGLNNTKQRDLVKVKAKTLIFIENLTRVTLKLEKSSIFIKSFSYLILDLINCIMVV